jgi:hypothetical protein
MKNPSEDDSLCRPQLEEERERLEVWFRDQLLGGRSDARNRQQAVQEYIHEDVEAIRESRDMVTFIGADRECCSLQLETPFG